MTNATEEKKAKPQQAPMAIGALNQLVIKLPTIDFLYEWDFNDKSIEAYLVLAQSDDGPWNAKIPIAELSNSPDAGWKTAAFENPPKTGNFDLLLNWMQDDEERNLKIFEDISMNDLTSGRFAEVNAEEPVFAQA